MNFQELYNKLKSSYTIENLNTITANIIYHYKNKDYSYIRELSKRVDNYIQIKETKVNKLYSRLVMLYHPDKLGHYLEIIEESYKKGNSQCLEQLSHILLVIDYNSNESYTITDEEIISSQDIFWGFNEEDLDYFSEISQEELINQNYTESTFTKTYTDFLSALKRKEYGNLNIDLNYYDLEMIEGELELSDYEIENLAGIEFCRNIISLNLSDNFLTDISNLVNLKFLENINLANNKISDILALSKLKNLKNIDISYNNITDLNPLFNNKSLKYLNITGNNIPTIQLKYLDNNGVIISC